MLIFRLINEGFLFAINSIVVNKLRTFLSLFGITIGIFAIISVFTVLDWMENSIQNSIATLGDDVIYIQKFPWSFDPDLAWWDILAWPQPSLDDYEALRKRSTKAEAANYSVYINRSLKYRDRQVNGAFIWCTTYELQIVRPFEIEEGRFFSQYESASGKPVAIIGALTAENIFEDLNPIGKELTIGGHKATVIGVFKKEGEGGITDSGMDEVTVIPVNFAKNIVNLRSNFIEAQLIVKAKSDASITELSDETIQILRANRRLGPAEESNFSVNRASLLSQGLDSIFASINIGGWIIGGFSILVGGFGIANIMFVSVKERTNIIGIQKALGAKKMFILWQFLFESVILSLLGGVFGLLFIFIGTQIISYLYDLSIVLTIGNIFLALFLSGSIGIVAGYAPAYSAAKMNPVDAIGYSF